MDSTNSLIASGAMSSSRPPPAETMERMLQSANYGMQVLQSAMAESNPDMRPATGMGDKDVPASKRQVNCDRGGKCENGWRDINHVSSACRRATNTRKMAKLVLAVALHQHLNGVVDLSVSIQVILSHYACTLTVLINRPENAV
jgi:hypothetical protein